MFKIAPVSKGDDSITILLNQNPKSLGTAAPPAGNALRIGGQVGGWHRDATLHPYV
jgi:hypothetical protein